MSQFQPPNQWPSPQYTQYQPAPYYPQQMQPPAPHKNEKAQTTAIWCISIALFLELLALLAGGILFWIAGFILTVIGLVFLSMV